MLSNLRGIGAGKNEEGQDTLDLNPTRWVRSVIGALVIAIVLLAVVPSLYSVLWAFWGTDTLGVMARRPTLQWFMLIMHSPQWIASLSYSSALAIFASGACALVLSIHFYYTRYTLPALERIAYVMVMSAALLPMVSYALALRQLSVPLHLSEWTLLLTGQVIMVLPVQFFMLESAQDAIPTDRIYAGSTLGAGHMHNFIWVYWPAVRSATMSAFILGAFIAFDELVLATFVIDSALLTAPRRLWNQINSRMDPTPAVVSTLLGMGFMIAVGFIVAWRRLRRRM